MGKRLKLALLVTGGVIAVAGTIALGVVQGLARRPKWSPQATWLVGMRGGTATIVLEDTRPGKRGLVVRLVAVDLSSGDTIEREWDHGVPILCDVPEPGALFCEVDGGVILDPSTLETRVAKANGFASGMGGDCGFSGTPAPGELTRVKDHLVFRRPESPRGAEAVDIPVAPIGGEPFPELSLVVGPRTLSGVRHDGTVAWSTPVGGKCASAVLVGKLLVFASDASPDRVVAVDVPTGAVRWRVP